MRILRIIGEKILLVHVIILISLSFIIHGDHKRSREMCEVLVRELKSWDY